MRATNRAELRSFIGELVAVVDVPRFPDNPGVVRWAGRYFIDPTTGSGLPLVVTYTEASLYEPTSAVKKET